MKNSEEIKQQIKFEIDKVNSENNNSDPTGSCTISTAFGTSCHNGLSLNGCNKVASKVGGTSSWTKGGKC